MRGYVAAFAAVLIAAAPSVAYGQNTAAAQALFQEGRDLMSKGDYAAACPKLEDSQRLDPAPGTLYNLATCYEKSGRTASAWATYQSAASAYRAAKNPEWETKARAKVSALEPKLSKLTIAVAEGQASLLEIKRDGTAVGTSEVGTAIPVDPGSHIIEANAPGKKKWVTTVKVDVGAQERVTIPPLEFEATVTRPKSAPPDDTGATAPPSAPAADRSSGSSQRTIGLVLGGVGLAGVAVGVVTGLLAISKNSDAEKLCPTDGACRSAEGVDANESARSMGTVSTIGFVAGGALVSAGAVLFFTAPSSARTGSLQLTPIAGPSAVGLRGAW